MTSPFRRPPTLQALIDTGANMSIVSPSVVSRLKPQQMASIPLVSVGGGLAWLRTFDVRIRFGGHTGPGRGFAIEAVEIQPATPGVDVLIGMTFFSKSA